MILTVGLGVLTLLCGYTDLRFRRIPNRYSVGGFVIGFLLQVILHGMYGLQLALAGAASGFGIMLLLHLLGAVGAGDVKLFGAIGAYIGVMGVLTVIIYSIIMAGVIGFGVWIVRGKLVQSCKQLMVTMIGVLWLNSWDWIQLKHRKQELLQFPFLWAVLPAVAAVIWESWS